MSSGSSQVSKSLKVRAFICHLKMVNLSLGHQQIHGIGMHTLTNPSFTHFFLKQKHKRNWTKASNCTASGIVSATRPAQTPMEPAGRRAIFAKPLRIVSRIVAMI